MKYWWCYLRVKFAIFAAKLNSELDARISRRRFYLINLIFIQETIFLKIVRVFFIDLIRNIATTLWFFYYQASHRLFDIRIKIIICLTCLICYICRSTRIYVEKRKLLSSFLSRLFRSNRNEKRYFSISLLRFVFTK